MLVRHRNREPSIDPLAYVAPSAVIVGDVRIAAGARVLHGAVLTAEDGEVVIGEDTGGRQRSPEKMSAGPSCDEAARERSTTQED